MKLEWNDIEFENKVKKKKKIAMTQYIVIVKTRITSILCILCVFSSIVIGSKKQKKSNLKQEK
jgi:heme O synthase-like polyprenyltransferase